MNMPTIDQIARTIDELVHNSALDPFEIDARLYVCDIDGAYLLSQGDNPYQLLEETEKPDNITAMALVVCGYACPHDPSNEKQRPSEHPDRERIRLVTCFDSSGSVKSIMRRADKADQVEDLGSEGEGQLRYALEDWWEE